MNETEQRQSAALPLAAAAARLGISPDALRMRMRRGKVRGFKRGGRLFVTLPEGTNAPVRPTTEQSEQSGLARFASPAGGGTTGPTAATEGPPAQALPVIVEFQKLELDRLLRDNARLNHRLDQLMDELVHLREMQQREQVLRQQDQALRQQIQATLDRLSARPPLQGPAAERPAPAAAGAGIEPGIERSMGADTAVAEAAARGPQVAPPAPPPPTASLGPGAPEADASGAPARPGGEAYAYAAGGRAGAAPDATPGAPSAGAAELADILKEIGQSLRDLEPAPPAVAGTASAPGAEAAAEAPGEADPGRRPMAREPAPGPALPPRAGNDAGRRFPAEAGAWRDDDEGRLLEILGRMGPSAEDRRSAARIMKRLLRGRGASRARDPES